ncbi:chemotaxis protein CheW [Noviherbaspirillum sp.]|uniref:chemotaxis protein CheW n=1 Tax=Noviherbaspirillum sp. TaxID=1926288 RepID=UPI002B4A4EAE|nr:chemotaxis protein CheW [Noviherbaspirillum sp.]HJV80263.1 chemotaxis protein CheW [Noviherbaspirillum sp.]
MSALVEAGPKAPQGQTISDCGQYLTFMLGGEAFAIGILAVKEIIEYGGLTEVPMMPECIRGVINLRGAVVPVMDLSARFGKAVTAVTKRTCIVIVEVDNGDAQQVVGVVVDAVNAVQDIAASEIEAPPSFGAKIRTDFIEGMGKVNGKFVILLNINQIVSLDELDALAEAASGPPATAPGPGR